MYCPKCGYDTGESKFCSECGEKIVTSLTDKVEETNAYYDALKKIEEEKAQALKEEKKQRNKKIKKSIKIIIKIVPILLTVALVITGIDFATKKIKTNIHQYDNTKDAIDENKNYESAYWAWETVMNPSDDKKEKALLKLGKYSFDNNNNEAALYFFNILASNGENKEAISVFDNQFKQYETEKEYMLIYDCISTYKRLGGNFDNSKIENWVTYYAENKSSENYLTLLKYLKNNKIDYDKKIEEYIPSIAKELFSKKQYNDAKSLYSFYSGDKDFKDEIVKCKIGIACNNIREGDYGSACSELALYYGDTDEYMNANILYIWAYVQNNKKNKSNYYLDLARSKLKSSLKFSGSYIEDHAYDVPYIRFEENEDENEPPLLYYLHYTSIYYSATNSFGGYLDDDYFCYENEYTEFYAYGLSKDEAEDLCDLRADDLINKYGV